MCRRSGGLQYELEWRWGTTPHRCVFIRDALRVVRKSSEGRKEGLKDTRGSRSEQELQCSASQKTSGSAQRVHYKRTTIESVDNYSPIWLVQPMPAATLSRALQLGSSCRLALLLFLLLRWHCCHRVLPSVRSGPPLQRPCTLAMLVRRWVHVDV